MHQLQNETGESVTLSIRHRDEVIFVERAVGSQSLMRVVHAYGARALLHVTATGKVISGGRWRNGLDHLCRAHPATCLNGAFD